MKRVLLVLAVLAFALPAVADSIVYFDGKLSSYSIGVSVNGSGSLNYTGGQDLLTSDRHWSSGALYAPSGFSGDVTHVLSNPQTEMLTARYTRNGNGVQIINGHLHEVILSYAGGFQNVWKVTLVSGYITPHKHRPLAAPEPETLSLMGIGLVFIGGVVRRKL
jgi:hypothetical protein